MVRKGDKVRIIPERGSTKKGDQKLWLVKKIKKNNKHSLATLEFFKKEEKENKEINNILEELNNGKFHIEYPKSL